MPDDEDYKWLADRLASPASWTEKDYSTICALARNQRDSLATMHPLDKKRRASVERAAEEMEAAMAHHESLRTERER